MKVDFLLRPLWQILAASHISGPDSALSCDECFAALEYLADCAVSGADPALVLESARHHLERCPHCRQHHLRLLRELEDHQTNPIHTSAA